MRIYQNGVFQAQFQRPCPEPVPVNKSLSENLFQHDAAVGDHVHYLDIARHPDCDNVLDRCSARPTGQLAAAYCLPATRIDLSAAQIYVLIPCEQGILHGQASQHLGQLVFYVFVPSLTFTKLASSVDLHNLTVWWPLPVNTALRYWLCQPGQCSYNELPPCCLH